MCSCSSWGCVRARELVKLKQQCDGRSRVKGIWERHGAEGQSLAETWFVKKDWSTGKSELSLWDLLFQWDFWGFLPSSIKTCGWDPSVAEISAVLWLQSHFQQPFLVARNILRICLCYRNKSSGLWALWVCMNDFCSVTKLTANSTMTLGMLSRFIR